MSLYNASAFALATYDKIDLSGKEVMQSDVGTCGGGLNTESRMRLLPRLLKHTELTASSKIHSPISPSFKLRGDGDVSPCPSRSGF